MEFKPFKKVKENIVASPKSTTKGVGVSIALAVITQIAIWVSAKDPILGELIEAHKFEIWTGVSGIIYAVVHYFSAKKDAA